MRYIAYDRHDSECQLEENSVCLQSIWRRNNFPLRFHKFIETKDFVFHPSFNYLCTEYTRIVCTSNCGWIFYYRIEMVCRTHNAHTRKHLNKARHANPIRIHAYFVYYYYFRNCDAYGCDCERVRATSDCDHIQHINTFYISSASSIHNLWTISRRWPWAYAQTNAIKVTNGNISCFWW